MISTPSYSDFRSGKASAINGGSVYGSGRKIEVHTLSDLRAMPERDYVVKGLISPGELSVFWGPPKSGKSFFVSHITYAIAQGRSVFGRRVKAAKVLYVSAEGESGVKGRARALEDRYKTTPDFLVIAQPINLLDPGADIESLISIINKHLAAVVILDTLARVLAGGDENASQDMGTVIRHIDRIRHETGAHVIVVHHGTKSGSNGPRGHGSLLGAADLVVEITKSDSGLRVATVTHAKDDPDGAGMAFQLDIVELGIDIDGDTRTTCLVKELENHESLNTKLKLKPGEKAALRILHDTVVGPMGCTLPVGDGFPSNLRGVREEVWYAECETRRLSSSIDPRDRVKVRQRAIAGLQAANMIASRGGLWWPTRGNQTIGSGIKGDYPIDPNPVHQ